MWHPELIDGTRAKLLRRLALSLSSGAKRRRQADRQLVETSGLFDADWYRHTYPDVAESGVDPLVHYLDCGWREGRDPGPDFGTEAYLEANPDVARIGVNPLLHFVEFGLAEGRATFGLRPQVHSRPAKSFNFGPPAPCVSFPVADETAAEWVRSDQLDPGHPHAFAAGSALIGYAPDPAVRRQCDGALALLEGLCHAAASAPPPAAQIGEPAERLADSWYVTSLRLRTRWSSPSYPFVVRAYQHEPGKDAPPHLVGEGAVASPLDVLDIHLRNPFFPLLFVIAEAEGGLRGARVLAFPSLCRGGAHYPELLWLSARNSPSGDPDPVRESDELSRRLLGLDTGDAGAAVRSVAVDFDGADGTGRLFQDDFQRWLAQVPRVSVAPQAEPALSPTDQHLAKAVSVTAPDARAGGGATLIIGGDMIPTITALTEPLRQTGSSEEIVAPLLSSEGGAPQLATLVELPANGISLLKAFPAARIAKWPRLSAGKGQCAPADFPPAAIRLSNRKDLTEAELFHPIGEVAFSRDAGQRAAITWIFEVGGWADARIRQAMQAVALQEGGADDSLALVGSASATIVSSAKQLFSGRVRTFPDLKSAVGQLDTPLASYVGRGVLLHDNRSASLFASLLELDTVATASCVLISTEKRGKRWRSSIVDGGDLASGSRQNLAPSNRPFPLKQLWRTNYPVPSPNPHLWAARSSQLASWLSRTRPLDASEGTHICSSLVTASLGEEAQGGLPVLPMAADVQVTRVEVFQG